MSSGVLDLSQMPAVFEWDEQCKVNDYLIARYQVSSTLPPNETALGMAMEQSAATTQINGYVEPQSLAPWTIRVRSYKKLPEPAVTSVVPYQLATEVYGAPEGVTSSLYLIELAIPYRLLAGKSGQLMNVLVGELPRLGFLTSFSLVSAPLHDGIWPGPGFGVSGLRELLNIPKGPLLCRSMRPAVGLDLATMARLNHDVLCGGFHLVKDDELQVFPDNSVYETHVMAMIEARDKAIKKSGEKKAYLANLICEPDELEERWEICLNHGVDGVLVAPFIQGIGILSQLAYRRVLPILAHNSGGDLSFRNHFWGINESVLASWFRSLGADWWVTPGNSGQPQQNLEEVQSVLLSGREIGSSDAPMMPILQGGKSPSGLPDYRQTIGNDDFMLIVASWVDRYPKGLKAGAQKFRQAIDKLVI